MISENGQNYSYKCLPLKLRDVTIIHQAVKNITCQVSENVSRKYKIPVVTHEEHYNFLLTIFSVSFVMDSLVGVFVKPL
jgi:hypothetical protein